MGDTNKEYGTPIHIRLSDDVRLALVMLAKAQHRSRRQVIELLVMEAAAKLKGKK